MEGRLYLSKKAVRILNLVKRDANRRPLSCRELFPEHDIMPFPCQYIYDCIAYVLRNGTRVSQFSHEHNTRNKRDFKLPHHDTVCYERHVFYSGAKFLNFLPAEIKIVTGTREKLSAVKEFLKAHNFYCLSDFYSG